MRCGVCVRRKSCLPAVFIYTEMFLLRWHSGKNSNHDQSEPERTVRIQSDAERSEDALSVNNVCTVIPFVEE